MHTAPASDRPRILICDPIHPDSTMILAQQADVDIVDGPSLTQSELEERISFYDAVIVRAGTALPASVIRRGKGLRVIARMDAGLEHIDTDVAREMGIAVVHYFDAQRQLAIETAEKVLQLLQRQDPATTIEDRPHSAAALSLHVAPVAQVHPHERFQIARVARLAERLSQEGVLVNPPIVAKIKSSESFVVLDGATRISAFRKLAYPHVVVQVIDMQRDNVQLSAWNHAVRDAYGQGGVAAFLELVESIQGLRLSEMSVEQVVNTVHERGALGYMLTAHQQAYLLEFDNAAPQGTLPRPDAESRRSAAPREWLDALNDLVDGYGRWGDVERVLSADIEQVRSMHDDVVALVVFPTFTPDMILQQAAQGRLLPAGITRFVIPGRILRLNAPLEKLIRDEPLSDKQDWLDRFVAKKLGDRQVRYYEEPVMLLDE